MSIYTIYHIKLYFSVLSNIYNLWVSLKTDIINHMLKKGKCIFHRYSFVPLSIRSIDITIYQNALRTIEIWFLHVKHTNNTCRRIRGTQKISLRSNNLNVQHKINIKIKF